MRIAALRRGGPAPHGTICPTAIHRSRRIIGDCGYDRGALDARLAARYEHHVENFLAFVQLEWITIFAASLWDEF